MSAVPADLGPRAHLLYHFCRLQLPAVGLSPSACESHLQRTFDLYRTKVDEAATWSTYLDNLHPLDWFVACACMEGNNRAWDYLFAARAGRSDCLLTDALRARASRLYPRNEERQESAVQEFWGHLYVADRADGLPVLARYDGQRPLVPWLIRVFQNWHVSQLRRQGNVRSLPDDDLALPLPTEAHGRWHETFAQAAREVLAELKDQELLILGLRLRYRLSQREVAGMLELHEGTVSRKTDALRDRCLERIGQRLLAEGWTGDDLSGFIHTEMYNLLLDDPRLSVDHLAHLMAAQGKKLPGAGRGVSTEH
jgi:RNA polymerase sigma factor (sigma-70 family)